MKILMVNRFDMFNKSGGDTIQLVSTKKYLEKNGVKVDIANSMEMELKDYDIIHLFNITRINETYEFCKIAKRKNIPIVLSPIYWNKNELRAKGYYNTRSHLSAIYSNIIDRFQYIKKKQEFVLNAASLILPNAEIEKKIIIDDFKVPSNKFRVVYNGVDTNFKNNIESYEKYNILNDLRDYVLCVAAINPRKNIHRLIRAISDLNLKLVIVGRKESPYFEFCKKQSNNDIIFLDHIDHSKISSIYSAARVHVLASLYETPGLSSLEAALFGCNIVSTNRGSAYEYFGNLVEYCDPFDIDSIKNAIINAYNKPKTSKLKNHILKNYTWDKIASDTLKCYEEVLSNYPE